MSLLDKISVNATYTRSINLERDGDSAALISSYIPTSRSFQILRRLTGAFGPEDKPRAWAMIGPYGSGKSAFGIFLSHLLGRIKDQSTLDALDVLAAKDNESNADVTNSIFEEIRKTNGYLPILLTGSPEPFAKKFVSATFAAAEKFWGGLKGRAPKVVDELGLAALRNDLTVSEIIGLLDELQLAVEKANGRGLLIIIDELGKFLEYEARHYGANDIYLLQALAEKAYKGSDTNLYVFVLMHQAFEQYSRGLGDNLRNEWAKVQGRYENIPFLETTEQVLRIAARAIEHDSSVEQNPIIDEQCQAVVEILAGQNALPGVTDEEEAVKIFASCYPLHPVSALILPLLCQKVAQNERTLFSYLGSKEPFGFKDSLARLSNVGDWVYPWEIYEYFIVNQSASLQDPLINRRWAEVVTAVERLGDAPAEEINLLKTIGLLNIIGVHGGLKASQDLVQLCMPTKAIFSSAAKALQKKSVLQFRKYSGEYRVWQGSDFDLEAAVQNELSQLGFFDLPEALNNKKVLPPVIARRYTIETGTLRYFVPRFVDTKSYGKEPAAADDLRLVLCVCEDQGDVALFQDKVLPYFSGQDLVALCPHGDRLREAVAEVLALKRVQANRHELANDPIAQREFKDRLSLAERVEDEQFAVFVDSPELSKWFRQEKELQVRSKREFQIILSDVLREVYHKAPHVKNELINRDNPSSQAIAARNKLLAALLNNSGQENLGIEKTPAEKGLYMALCQATGLHRQVDGQWQLCAPYRNDAHNLNFVWDEIESFLEATESQPAAFTELNKKLKAPPYGVKDGLLPILYVAAYLCYQHELAFYEDGVYVPIVTLQHLERFFKRPEIFSVQRFRIQGLRASIFKHYAQVISGDADKEQTISSIVRPIAKFMTELPDYTKNTGRLSPTAQNVRKAFFVAKSPEKLLFEGLPQACGYSVIDPNDVNESKLEGFSEAIINALRELKNAYPKLREKLKRNIAAVLIDKKNDLSLSELRQALRGRFDGLDQFTVDVKGLRSFLRILCDRIDTDEIWFDNVLLFLGDRSSKKWTDLDFDSADLRLSEYSRRISDLQLLSAHNKNYRQRRDGDFEVILLRSVRQGKTENDQVVCIDDDYRKLIAGPKEKIKEILSDNLDPKLRMAILADLVDEILSAKSNKAEVHDEENSEVG